MDLIIGLGNPGKKYENTRHNVGFMALDKMASDFKFVKKFNADVAESTPPVRGESAVPPCQGGLGGVEKTIFAKPQTFMNLSGQAVQQIISFYKIQPENLTVIHDDLDIPLGEFKIQKNRSSAGHNGVQSIIEQLGTQDFTRVRIGISTTPPAPPYQGGNAFVPPDRGGSAEKFVLEKFNKEELKIVEKVLENIKIDKS